MALFDVCVDTMIQTFPQVTSAAISINRGMPHQSPTGARGPFPPQGPPMMNRQPSFPTQMPPQQFVPQQNMPQPVQGAQHSPHAQHVPAMAMAPPQAHPMMRPTPPPQQQQPQMNGVAPSPTPLQQHQQNGAPMRPGQPMPPPQMRPIPQMQSMQPNGVMMIQNVNGGAPRPQQGFPVQNFAPGAMSGTTTMMLSSLQAPQNSPNHIHHHQIPQPQPMGFVPQQQMQRHPVPHTQSPIPMQGVQAPPQQPHHAPVFNAQQQQPMPQAPQQQQPAAASAPVTSQAPQPPSHPPAPSSVEVPKSAQHGPPAVPVPEGAQTPTPPPNTASASANVSDSAVASQAA